MRIIQLLAPAHAGGLERVVQGLAIGQQARGHQVTVAAVVQESLKGHPFLPPLERAGIAVREIIVPHRAYLQERAAVAALCRELKPDVVHSHGYRTDVVDGGAVRKLGIATVSTAHGATRGSWKNRLYEAMHWRMLKRFDAVIAVSRPLASQLLAIGASPARVHFVPNAWSEIAIPLNRAEAQAVLGMSAGARVLGWVGRMSREKGVDVLIDAMARVTDPAAVACVIGDGPERAPQELRSRELVTNRVQWKGMIPEAGRLCKGFDVFVLSSRTEGIPIALLEAVAAGTPIVATRVGGVPDVVTEREAWLVPPENPAALAAAINEALANPDVAAEKAGHARTRLDVQFGRDAWLTRHEEVYAAAQAARRARS